ncbi:hypothetical protein Pd630_LPD08055 [Rhodococcus opacus PD630]|nr:hypothetical protein Pd630_LPD08055 [Rhodococcus opacus PD630]
MGCKHLSILGVSVNRFAGESQVSEFDLTVSGKYSRTVTLW